jgi:hypothetical protein
VVCHSGGDGGGGVGCGGGFRAAFVFLSTIFLLQRRAFLSRRDLPEIEHV